LRKLFPLILLAVALFLAACNGGDDSENFNNNDVQTLTLNPATVTMNPGQVQQIVAIATLTNGATVDATVDADWSSSNRDVATVNDVGVVTAGNTAGTATITASLNGVSGTSTVTVGGGAATGLTLTPNNAFVLAGSTLQLATAGANGTTTYSSNNTGVATVDSLGLVTGVAAGQATITGSTTTGQTGSVTVNVYTANVFTATGSTPAGILGTVDTFRAELGTLNPNNTTQFPGGRREINWDGVPGALTNTDTFPSDFFNTTSPRGVIFTSTNGTGFRVSDNLYGDINGTYPSQFQTFSAPRLFAVRSTTTFDTQFFLAASSTPGFSSGFGAVFVDPDNDVSRIDYVLPDGSLFSRNVPSIPGSQGLSFLGVSFQGARVSRVTLVTGDGTLAAGNNDVTNGGTSDIVVVDDFIYGEPQPTP
jgi:hypothetical protein